MKEQVEMDYRENFLRDLKESAAILGSMRKTDLKYPIIKRILKDIIARIPDGSQIPPIRHIASELGVSMVSVHKAMAELKNENIISTKSTSGYTKGTTRPVMKDIPFMNGLAALADHSIRFATDSNSPIQKALWEKIVSPPMLGTKYSSLGVEMLYSSFDSLGQIAASGVDIIESNPLHYRELKLEDFSFDIREYLKTDLEKSSNLKLLEGGQIPIYYQTAYLMYDVEKLKKLRLPFPDYKNFQEQMRYFSELRKAYGKLGIKFQIGSVFSPLHFIGTYFHKFVQDLFADKSSPEKESCFEEAARQTMDLGTVFTYYETKITGRGIDQCFIARNIQFLVGSSSHFWQLSGEPPFDIGAYPIFNVDDKCLKMPMFPVVLKNTQDPVGAVKFLLYLLSERVQRLFAETGAVPADSRLFRVKGMSQSQTEFFRDLFNRSEPFQLLNSPAYYVFMKIMGTEFLANAIAGQQIPGDDFKRMIQYSKTYISSCNNSQ